MDRPQQDDANAVMPPLDRAHLDDDEFAKLKRFLYPAERPYEPTDSDPVNFEKPSRLDTGCYSVAEEGLEGGFHHPIGLDGDLKQDHFNVAIADAMSRDATVDHHAPPLDHAIKSRIAKIEEEISVGQLRTRLLRLEEMVSTAPSFDNLVRLEEQIEEVRQNVHNNEKHLAEMIAEQIANAHEELLSAVQMTATKACEEAACKVQSPQGDAAIGGLNIDDIARILTPFYTEEGEQRKKSIDAMTQRIEEVEGALAEINARCEEQYGELGKRLSEFEQKLDTECDERKAENRVQREFLQEMNSGMRGILAKVGELDEKDQQASSFSQRLQKDVDTKSAPPSAPRSPSVCTALGTPASRSATFPSCPDTGFVPQQTQPAPRAEGHASAGFAPASPRTLTNTGPSFNQRPGLTHDLPKELDPRRVLPSFNTGAAQAMRMNHFQASNSLALLPGQHRSQSRERAGCAFGHSAPGSLVPHYTSPRRGLSPGPSPRGHPGGPGRGMDETNWRDALMQFGSQQSRSPFSSFRSASQEPGWAQNVNLNPLRSRDPSLNRTVQPLRSRDPSREDVRLQLDGLTPSSSTFSMHEKVQCHEKVIPGQVDKAMLTGQAIPAQHVTPQQLLAGPQPRLQQPSPVPLPQQHGGAAQPKLAMPRGSSPSPASRSSPSGAVGPWQAIR